MAATQVQTGFTATIEARFYADGVLADDGAPTIGITRADGTVLVAPGTATTSGGIGIRRYTLPAQAEVNLLKATWTGATQTVVTWVEIVGDILYTLAALRAVKVAGTLAFADTTLFPNQTLLDRRAEVTDDFEKRTGWSFIPRFARQTLDGDGRSELILDHLKCSKLLSVTVDGVAQTLSDFVLDRSGVLTWTNGRFPTTKRQNVVVEVVHGWDRPPAVISSAGLARTAMLLQPSQFNGAVTVTTPDGASYQYSQAGQSFAGGGRRYYGQPDVDAVLSDPAYNASSAGAFA